MRLSAHFSLEEFTRSPTVAKLGIDNTPTAVQIQAMELLCDNILEPIRNHFKIPIRIKSGFRCAALNKAVGGSETSQHTLGEAADIEIYGIRNDDLWQFIADSLNYDQVIAERLDKDDGSEGWIHVSHKRNGKQRNEALSFLGNGKYVKGLQYAN